jgi:hypothetical protein
MMKNLITTTMDTKDFRANFPTVRVRHNGYEVTAAVEILHDDVDMKTGIFTMEIGLRLPPAKPSLNVVNGIAVLPIDYKLTQGDYDAVIKGEVIDVPARN